MLVRALRQAVRATVQERLNMEDTKDGGESLDSVIVRCALASRETGEG